jgi:hypothetical protein
MDEWDTSAYVDIVNHAPQLFVSRFKSAYKQIVAETRNGETATLYNGKPGSFALYVGWR